MPKRASQSFLSHALLQVHNSFSCPFVSCSNDASLAIIEMHDRSHVLQHCCAGAYAADLISEEERFDVVRNACPSLRWHVHSQHHGLRHRGPGHVPTLQLIHPCRGPPKAPGMQKSWLVSPLVHTFALLPETRINSLFSDSHAHVMLCHLCKQAS